MGKLKGKAKRAFLARMARGRNKTAAAPKRRKNRKHKHKESHVARRRKGSSHHRKGGKRRAHHGAMGKWLPEQARLVSMGASFAYGKLEAAATKDGANIINKVPTPIKQIGRAGNLGALLWLAGVITKHQMVKNVASGVIHVAAYQNGRGAGFGDSQDFKLAGPGRGRDEILVDQYLRRRGGE